MIGCSAFVAWSKDNVTTADKNNTFVRPDMFQGTVSVGWSRETKNSEFLIAYLCESATHIISVLYLLKHVRCCSACTSLPIKK